MRSFRSSNSERQEYVFFDLIKKMRQSFVRLVEIKIHYQKEFISVSDNFQSNLEPRGLINQDRNKKNLKKKNTIAI